MAGSTASAGSPKSYIKPPWGIGATLRQDSGEDKGPFVGKHFVPLPPKSKPVDHFDVIAMYDAVKAQEEREEFRKNGYRAQKMRVKANLDSQMLELEGLRKEEQGRRERERERLRVTVERDNELTRKENEVELAKRTKMMEANGIMREQLRQKEQQARERRQREQDHMLSWLEAEKQRRDEENRTQALEHARVCHTMRSQMLTALEEEQAKRKAERAMDVEMVKAQVAQIDDRAERNREAVRQRFAVIDRNCATLGKQIEARDAKMEKDLQESMKRATEEFERRANEKDRRERSDKERRTREMVETLHEQMKEKSERCLVDEEANRIQVDIWRKQMAEFEAAEEKKKVWLKEARHDVDQKLVEQMRENAQRHPSEKGEPHLSEALKIRDAAFNRPLYEKMLKEGFREELTGELSKAQFSKLDPHPSVGRSQQHLGASEVKEKLDKVKALTKNNGGRTTRI
jgi:hypothetical protein